MPKTLAEIAIEAGLLTKTTAARAGRLAEQRGEPLVVTVIKELGVDEVALLGAIRKGTRVPLIDPADVQVEAEALRAVPRDVCVRLRVLPLAVVADGGSRVLRVAMADPTDTSAVAELEELTRGEIEVSALPLSAIDELLEEGARSGHTAVTRAARPGGGGARGRTFAPDADAEISVTAQVPIAALQQALGGAPDDVEARLDALIRVLTAKGLVTEAELAEALRKGKPGP